MQIVRARRSAMMLSDFVRRDPSRGRWLSFVFTFLFLLSGGMGAWADCLISGPNPVFAGSTNSFNAIPSTNSATFYVWSISSNDAGAAMVGDTNLASVQILA